MIRINKNDTILKPSYLFSEIANKVAQYQIETPEELKKGLNLAFNSGEPIFLDIKSEPESDDIPPVYSWVKPEV